jgi:hypothetical protein
MAWREYLTSLIFLQHQIEQNYCRPQSACPRGSRFMDCRLRIADRELKTGRAKEGILVDYIG